MIFKTDKLTLTHEQIGEGQLWNLETMVEYDANSGEILIVNPGFITDGASVPRIFRIMFPPWGTYSRSAVVHDMLCWSIEHKKLNKNFRQASKLFHEMMIAEGVGQVMRTLLFCGVYFWAWITDHFPIKHGSSGVGYPQ